MEEIPFSQEHGDRSSFFVSLDAPGFATVQPQTHACTYNTSIPVADFAFVAIDNILCESLLIAPMLIFKMAKIF